MTQQIARTLDSRTNSRFLAAALLVLAAPLAFAQTGPGLTARPEPPPTVADPSVVVPEYDVFSMKPNKSGSGMIRMGNGPDGFTATNISLKNLIANAYGIREDLISGAPGWVESDRFDVTAKVSGDDVATFKKLTFEQRSSMLFPLLADRLKLKTHYETRDLPVYELVIAKGGSRLHEATPGDTYPNGLKGPDGGTAHPGMMMMQPGKITAQAVPITSLINILSRQLQRTIIDKTGLTGKYDITLQWSPEEGQGMGFPGAPPPPPPPPSSDASAPSPSSGPSIFTAIEEQLGLKLNSTKGPVKTLVIDHIEPPTEN